MLQVCDCPRSTSPAPRPSARCNYRDREYVRKLRTSESLDTEINPQVGSSFLLREPKGSSWRVPKMRQLETLQQERDTARDYYRCGDDETPVLAH